MHIRIATSILIVFLLGCNVAPIPDMTPTSLPDYDPARYGLPATLAGYKALMVLTSDNTACMPAGIKRLVLEASDPDLESYLENSRALEIQTELARYVKAEEWVFEIVGPGSSVETILSENEKWNQHIKENGCIELGGPHDPAFTPSP